ERYQGAEEGPGARGVEAVLVGRLIPPDVARADVVIAEVDVAARLVAAVRAHGTAVAVADVADVQRMGARGKLRLHRADGRDQKLDGLGCSEGPLAADD